MALQPLYMTVHEHRVLLNGLLRQRRCLAMFNTEYNVNRSDLEVMGFAFTQGLFNAYKVRKHFFVMNIQQVQRTIKKLERKKILEAITLGKPGNPTIYVLTTEGERVFKEYIENLNQLD